MNQRRDTAYPTADRTTKRAVTMTDERPREAPAERFDAPCLGFDLHEEARAIRAESTPAHAGHRQKTLYKRGGRTIALFVMDAGAMLHEHAAAGVVSIQSIEGEIVTTVQGAAHHLRPGQLLTMPPGVRHAVHARMPSAFLLQVSLEAPQRR